MAIIETPKDLCSANVDIAIWHITESEQQLINLCHNKGIDANITNGTNLEKRRIEILCEHLLIEHLTSQVCHLQHTCTGAPVLQSQKHCNISISHTSQYVAVAISSHRLGIDIERHTPQVLRVRDKFLTESEKESLPATDITANVAAWTAKEAMYKIINVPGIYFSHQISIDSSAIASGHNKYQCRYGKCIFYAHTHQADDYVATLVTEYK